MNDDRQKQISDLRRMIDWFESHPEIPLPSSSEFSIYQWDSKEQAAIMAKAMGTCRKESDDSFFYLHKTIGTMTVRAVFSRNQICERVVVGTKEIETEQVDPVALAALPKTKVKKQVEIVEWKCPELLPSGNG